MIVYPEVRHYRVSVHFEVILADIAEVRLVIWCVLYHSAPHLVLCVGHTAYLPISGCLVAFTASVIYG